MGGSKQQEPQYIQPPPQPSAASHAGESAAAVSEARLKYDPQLVAQQSQLYSQYAPQQARAEFGIQQEIAPLQKALYERLIPSLVPFQQQVQQRITSPQGLSFDQQAAQDAIRQRQRDALSQQIRESANLGGTLYSGNRQLQENRAQQELAQAFATQDIGLMDQRRLQALQEQAQLFSLVPGVNAPNVQGLGQTYAPSSDALLAALQQQRQPVLIPGQAAQPSPLWALGGQAAGAGAMLGTAAILA